MKDFGEAIIPIIAIIFTFGIPGVIIFWAIWVKHKEKMKLLEMGMTPQEAREYFKDLDKRPRNPYSALKWGIMLTMIGLGLLTGIILDEAGYTDSLTAVTILVFAGIGFLIYYMIMNSKSNKAKTETAQN